VHLLKLLKIATTAEQLCTHPCRLYLSNDWLEQHSNSCLAWPSDLAINECDNIQNSAVLQKPPSAINCPPVESAD